MYLTLDKAKKHLNIDLDFTDDDNYIYVVSSKVNNVRELVQNLNKTFNGKGGGRDTYAQGKITAESKDEIKSFVL